MTEEANVSAYPLAGYVVHTLPQSHALIVWELVPNEQALQTGERMKIPMTMTSAQAREIADMLVRTAVASEMGQSPTKSRN
jgi:hypothetical protein